MTQSSRTNDSGDLFAFTQEGVAMLPSVLRSPRAVQTSIAIVRAFVHTRQLIAPHHDLAARISRSLRFSSTTLAGCPARSSE